MKNNFDTGGSMENDIISYLKQFITYLTVTVNSLILPCGIQKQLKETNSICYIRNKFHKSHLHRI